MSDYRPYEHCDYRINDLLIGGDEPPGNRLLDEDGKPKPRPGSKSLEGLAAMAAVLDQYGPDMEPEHFEKAVWWIKDWKRHRSGWRRAVNAGAELHQSMERLKCSTEFARDGRRARRYSYGSHFFALLTGVAAVLALDAWTGNAGSASKLGWAIATLFLAGLTAAFRDVARDIWQRQDRRYFLQCLRLSRCTDDLLDVGLFSYHRDTLAINSTEEYLTFRRAVREMQLQLADALYFDLDGRIREQFNERKQAYSLNWPKKVGS